MASGGQARERGPWALSHGLGFAGSGLRMMANLGAVKFVSSRFSCPISIDA